MHRTRVAILLVSKAFLDSGFIKSEEEPFFIKAAKANVLTVLWVNLDLDLKNEEGSRIRDLISFQAINSEPVCGELLFMLLRVAGIVRGNEISTGIG